MRRKLELIAFCRYPIGVICSGAVCLFFCLNVVTVSSFGQVVLRGQDAAVRAQENRRKLLAPAFKMLKAERVPFDPKLLLVDDWRSRLEPALARMPAMGKTVRVTEPMKGVYLAGPLLLPEHTSLIGDTFILTRELAADDENSTVSISGDHQLFIFNIGESKKFEAMLRSRTARGLFNIDVNGNCAIVGIPPIYIGTIRCRGERGMTGGWNRRT